MVREVAETDPRLARDALDGLRAYQQAAPPARPPELPVVATVAGTRLIDHGGDGPPVVLVPSLINPPRILDLDPDVSLARAIAAMGRRVLLVDWGKAATRSDLDVSAHIEERLLPLLDAIDEPPVLVGYCLGGTMAIAAAGLTPVAGLATLAAPWDFSLYPREGLDALERIWSQSEGMAGALGALPMEVLQAAFWSLDRVRTVRKFAAFGALDPASAEARRFVELEEWANQGEPLPYPAARELIDDLFANNATASGQWTVGGKVAAVPEKIPVLHLVAADDLIAPSATAPPGSLVTIAAGHVGMLVGTARHQLHAALARFLALDP